MKKTFLTLLIWCALLSSAAQAGYLGPCEPLLKADSIDDFIELGETRHRSLRLMTLNTQGFHLYRNLNPKQKAKPKQKRYLKKVEKWANAIVKIDPDITVLQEVYSEYELQYLISTHLNDEFEYRFKAGHDGGSHVAFLIKKNLGLQLEFRSNKHRKWLGRFLFSRDAPVLILKDPRSKSVVTAVIGHHAKSQRDREGDPKSVKLRTRQNNEIVKIAKELTREFDENLPVFAAGDFNADLHRDKSTQSLADRMTDVFDLLARPPPNGRRTTHSYFSQDQHEQTQLDGIVVFNPAEVRVRRADVYRYRDEQGNEYPLPKDLKERKTLPSDHNPVWADISIPSP